MSTGSRDGFAHLHVHTEYSMLDGAARLDRPVRAHRRARHARDRDDRPRQRVRRLRVLVQGAAPPGSSRSSAWRPTSTPNTPRQRAQAGALGRRAATTTSPAGGAYTHMTLLAETTEGMHNLFRLSSLAPASRATSTSRASTASCCTTYGAGLIATTGCPSGEVQTRLRLGQYDEARQAAAEFQDIFGKDNYFVELMDHGLDIETPGPRRPAPARQGPRHPADRHQRLCTTSAARTPPPTELLLCVLVGLDDDRPEAVQVRRRRLLPEVRRARCATCGATCPRPATTRC